MVILLNVCDKRETPAAPYVRYLVKKEKETGNLIDKPKREMVKTMRTPENIAAVAESMCEAPSLSIHRRSQQLNISETSLRRIMHKELGMTPYKIQLVQELKPIDHPMHFRFVKRACDQLTEGADFTFKIVFSNEARFYLGGYVNKQKFCIWGTENPHAYIEKPTHPK